MFSDVNMPGSLNGLDLGNLVKKKWPEIYVLLTSGYLSEEQDASDFDLLQKPYRVAELVSKLREKLFKSAET